LDQRQMYGYRQAQQSPDHARKTSQATFPEGKTRTTNNDAVNNCTISSHDSPKHLKSHSPCHEMLTLRLEAKSPLMNPNAAVFTTATSPAYNIPCKY
jgi:hypothetical protein